MELVDVVETVAVWLTYGTFFMGIPAVLDIIGKKRAEPGHAIGFTIGLAMSTAWYHVGLYAPNPLASAQVYGLLINGACMSVFFLYTDDKSIAVKYVGSVLAMHLGLTYFGANIAPSAEWAEGGVVAFALMLNALVAVMPLLSINDVKRHKCTFPMGMDLKMSSLLLALSVAWGLHSLLVGEIGSTVFNGLLASAWATVVYFNMIYPFNPPSGSKKKVPAFSLKRVATSLKDFGDKVSGFTLEDFGGFGEEKMD